MTIQVLQKDIDEGEACNCRDCPLALAIKRAYLPETPEVKVCPFHVIINGIKRFRLPSVATDFINWFDTRHYRTSGLIKGPFSFELK